MKFDVIQTENIKMRGSLANSHTLTAMKDQILYDLCMQLIHQNHYNYN